MISTLRHGWHFSHYAVEHGEKTKKVSHNTNTTPTTVLEIMNGFFGDRHTYNKT